ncbi:DUF262 domain-containing protein [Saccharomonospora halophila]|uniref:DUF262 domain-containing protein n=1 Tax=Saccharomonospora halophila TaxID=129922 RepID=UPI000A055A4B|nr:DUF262 domain-containing protein [Saccharomonospora halophila]
MRTAATNRRLRVLLTELREDRLTPNPAFQRRLVWSNVHKSAFLETVLQGLPFPEIFISAGPVNPETGEGKELIVDGQQRVTTLYQYFTHSPDLKLTNGVRPYSELNSEEKIAFLEYEVVVRDLGSLTEEETRQLFYRINSTSYALNAMEVNNARFDGELKKFCDKLSEDDFFQENNVFTSYDAKRMNDVRWCLTLVITLLSNYFNRDSEHEIYLERYNDEFPQETQLSRDFRKAANFIDKLALGEKSRAWQKTDLFTLIVEVYRLGLSVEDDVETAKNRLENFYAKVNRIARGVAEEHDRLAAEYFAATRSGANDRSSRVRRGVVVNSVLQGDSDGFRTPTPRSL